MIPDYKLYHGAVLAEIVDVSTIPVTFGELLEDGRLTSYTVNETVGVHIKHSTQRLHPWQFTFTGQNLTELMALRLRFKDVFVVFVCHTDGMVCLSLAELSSIIEPGGNDQAWVRIDRRKGEWYSVSGVAGELTNKKPKGVGSLLEVIASH